MSENREIYDGIIDAQFAPDKQQHAQYRANGKHQDIGFGKPVFVLALFQDGLQAAHSYRQQRYAPPVDGLSFLVFGRFPHKSVGTEGCNCTHWNVNIKYPPP